MTPFQPLYYYYYYYYYCCYYYCYHDFATLYDCTQTKKQDASRVASACAAG
jgi:hypothetical protein